MGLAAYGTPAQVTPVTIRQDGYAFDLEDMSDIEPNDQYDALRERLLRFFSLHNYPFHRGDGPDIMAYANFAASIQDVLESSIHELFCALQRRGGSDRLVLGGGVAMNCTMIGKLSRTPGVADVYVPPFPYDAGVSAGAALALADRHGEITSNERLRSAYLGMDFTTSDIEEALAGSGLACQPMPEGSLLDESARLLDDNRVLGWFHGRAEVGKRALGHRSIIANPRHRGNLVRVNEIKGREMWRPLAPSVLEEYLADFFETGASKAPFDFMLAAAKVRPSSQPIIPATVHVDGSARPQAVSRDTNPLFWGLINRFRQLTGVPALLNTSFNLAGSPIVNSPQDAVSTFVKSDLDALAIGNYLVTKKN